MMKADLYATRMTIIYIYANLTNSKDYQRNIGVSSVSSF